MIDTGISLNAQSLEGKTPDWMLLVAASPAIAGRDGRVYRNPGADMLANAWKSEGLDIVIDIEHATHLQADKGLPAPAYGWIVDMEDRDGALWGKVEWTADGQTALSAKAYRYYSPAYQLDKDGTILRVVSVGLTNTPNLRLPSLNHQGGDAMDKFLQDVVKALGLNNDASESDVLAKIGELQKAVSLNSQQDLVPRSDLTLALNRAQTAETALAAMQTAAFEAERDAAIDKAVADGKVAPASKEYYRTSCNSQEALAKFVSFVTESAPIVAPGSEAPEKKPDDKLELNSEQLEIAALLGISKEDAEKFHKEAN